MACRKRGMTTQEYRRSYNYREEYFKQNPGLFGTVWFCSQCFKPLIGRHNVVVDHIVPLNKGGRNHVSNCTAICQRCNSSKSDKVDGRVIKGKIFKIFESTSSRANRGVGAVASLGVGLTAGAVSGAAHVGKRAVVGTAKVGSRAVKKTTSVGARGIGKLVKGVFGLVTFPLRKGSVITKLAFIAIYTMVILYFLSEKTSLLDAWF